MQLSQLLMTSASETALVIPTAYGNKCNKLLLVLFAEYLKYVTDWFKVLLPMMRPLLYSNDGPVISIQVTANQQSTNYHSTNC